MNNTVKLGLKKATLVVMAAGMVNTSLTSCSSMRDSTKTKSQGTSFGALAGGLLGAGIGLVAGGNTKSVLIGAAAGALLGGIGGYAWGDSIVKEKEAYASMEEYISDNQKQLDTRISDVQQANTDLSNQIAKLKADKTAVSKENIAKQNAKLTENLALIDTDITTAKDAAMEATGDDLAELNKKIDALSKEKKRLQSNINELDSLASI